MNNKITGNEPAFPNALYAGPDDHAYVDGMTLRQYYAGLVMQGLCASGFFTDKKLQQQAESAGSNISKALVISSLDIADEMINLLNKT